MTGNLICNRRPPTFISPVDSRPHTFICKYSFRRCTVKQTNVSNEAFLVSFILVIHILKMIVLLLVYFCASLTIILIVLLSIWYYNDRKFEAHLGKFPGPKPLPLVGNALPFSSTTKIIPALMEMQARYGRTFRLYFATEANIVVGDLKGLEFTLSSNSLIDKSDTYNYFNRWLGTGLLTSTGEKWKQHRKILTPAFHFQILEQFVDVFNTSSDILIEKLSMELNKTSVDIYPFIQLSALDVICESSMGTCINAQVDSHSKYVQCVKDMARIVIERAFSPIQIFETIYRFSYNYYLELQCLKVLHTFTRDVIQKRKKLLNNIEEKENEFGIKKRMAFLDILLKSRINGEPSPDESIREEVDTFMFEGHDTTSSAISFTLFCLSNHQDIQAKVVDEFKVIFDDDWERSVTYKDLQEMKYLELVIKETLRMYPAVPLIGRKTVKDVEFENKIIPKNTMVDIFIYGIHRDPEFFPNPEKFDPERFRPENIKDQNPYVYVPFSAGPRNCIGQRFAMLEIKATVSKILRQFELLPTFPAHKPILSVESILKSTNGLNVRLKSRS